MKNHLTSITQLLTGDLTLRAGDKVPIIPDASLVGRQARVEKPGAPSLHGQVAEITGVLVGDENATRDMDVENYYEIRVLETGNIHTVWPARLTLL